MYLKCKPSTAARSGVRMSCCVHVLTCPHLPQDGFQWVFLDLNLVLTLDRHSFCFQVKDFSFFFFSCLLLFGFITSRRCLLFHGLSLNIPSELCWFGFLKENIYRGLTVSLLNLSLLTRPADLWFCLKAVISAHPDTGDTWWVPVRHEVSRIWHFCQLAVTTAPQPASKSEQYSWKLL